MLDVDSHLDVVVCVPLAVKILEAVEHLQADVEDSRQGDGLLARLEKLLNVRAKPRHDHEPKLSTEHVSRSSQQSLWKYLSFWP